MSDAVSPELLPLFLKLDGRDVLVVGAGEVAERKVASLLEAGARVRVVAPEATEAIAALARDGRVGWSARAFADSDPDGFWLVFAATAYPEAQRRVSNAAAARGASSAWP